MIMHRSRMHVKKKKVSRYSFISGEAM